MLYIRFIAHQTSEEPWKLPNHNLYMYLFACVKCANWYQRVNYYKRNDYIQLQL